MFKHVCYKKKDCEILEDKAYIVYSFIPVIHESLRITTKSTFNITQMIFISYNLENNPEVSLKFIRCFLPWRLACRNK